jgi:hypothetical protein
MPGKLEKYLGTGNGGPGLSGKEIKAVFGNLKMQLGFEMGSPERAALVRAYEDVQLVMTVSATAVVAAASVFIFIWKDVRLMEV